VTVFDVDIGIDDAAHDLDMASTSQPSEAEIRHSKDCWIVWVKYSVY
jgi:hypothetical protein